MRHSRSPEPLSLLPSAPFRTLSCRSCVFRHQLPPQARAYATIPYSHCHCRALVEPQLHTLPCPGLLPTSPGLVQLLHSAVPWFHFHQRSLTPVCVQTTVMVHTRGGSRLRPRIRFSTQSERSRPQFQLRFQTPCQLQSPRQSLRSLRGSGGTRRGWDPGPCHLCLSGDLGGPGPPSGPVLPARVSHPHPDLSHHQLHQLQRRHHRHSYRLPPGSGGRYSSGTPSRGMYGFTREFHQESYYDVPALMADQRFRDSMRLIEHYSLLPFMTPRQFYYPRVVLQFYHSMTSRGAPSPLELRFTIDDRPGVLRAADISAALGLQAVQANAGGYRDWPQLTQWEMVRILARDATAGPILFRRQLPPQMLLVDHLFRTSLFPLQHYVQRRGAILEALYWISEGYWFSPSELVMTSHYTSRTRSTGRAWLELRVFHCLCRDYYARSSSTWVFRRSPG